MRELEMLIADGQRISKESATRGYMQQEINFIGSMVKEEKDNIYKVVSEGGVGTICIHGIAGVGKTAIAAAINNQALRVPERFDFVIWVDVLDGADLQQVQEDIARSISINLPPDSNIKIRASILRTTLTGKSRFLLILDSIWQGYSPSNIGIPDLTRGCKLIVTLRILSTFNSFRGRETYKIEPLIGADAWNLFVYEAGSEAHHIKTKELTDYWMWEELPGSGTLAEMRSNGRQRLNELLDAGFLEDASEVGKDEKVKMPNLFRDMALAIASQQFLVKAGNEHTNFPLVESEKSDTCSSSPSNDAEQVLDELDCGEMTVI
ncbi:hypothetical protein Ancab_004715 [Ancistrocladus abbreviatus]